MPDIPLQTGVDVKRGERSERVKEIGPRVLSKYMRKKLDERRRQKEMMGEDAGDVEEEYFLSKLKRKKLKREKSNRSSSAGLVTISIVLCWFPQNPGSV